MLLPFLKRSLTGFWNSRYLHNYVQAHKDTFYRFLNNESFNWRKLVYLVALKAIAMSDDVPLKEKVLIADDSICPKSGKAIELVSYHFDHKVRRSIIGNQYLQLGFHNGLNFFPLDGAFHTSSHWPYTHVREIDKHTNGWKRRTESLRKKTDVLVKLIDRAWKSGIDASFVLFNSWFSHDDIIRRIVTFTSKYRKKEQTESFTITAVEFIRRFLLHSLPKRFVRIRHYGFLANRNRSMKLTAIRQLMGLSEPPEKLVAPVEVMMQQLTGIDITVCLCCKKGKMQLFRKIPKGVARPPNPLVYAAA